MCHWLPLLVLALLAGECANVAYATYAIATFLLTIPCMLRLLIAHIVSITNPANLQGSSATNRVNGVSSGSVAAGFKSNDGSRNHDICYKACPFTSSTGLCCTSSHPICCDASVTVDCCTTSHPVCCGNGRCCSNSFPVCCNDGTSCCASGTVCDYDAIGRRICSCELYACILEDYTSTNMLYSLQKYTAWSCQVELKFTTGLFSFLGLPRIPFPPPFLHNNYSSMQQYMMNIIPYSQCQLCNWHGF